MSGGYKLIIIAMSLLLALTYVNGLQASAENSYVSWQGNTSVPYMVSILNTASYPVTLSFSPEGPFTVELVGETVYQLSAHDSKVFTVYLTPTPIVQPLDTYSGSLRIDAGLETVSLPLHLEKTTNTSLIGTGLVSGIGSINLDFVVDGFLLIIIIVLAIALFARVNNRVGGY